MSVVDWNKPLIDENGHYKNIRYLGQTHGSDGQAFAVCAVTPNGKSGEILATRDFHTGSGITPAFSAIINAPPAPRKEFRRVWNSQSGLTVLGGPYNTIEEARTRSISYDILYKGILELSFDPETNELLDSKVHKFSE